MARSPSKSETPAKAAKSTEVVEKAEKPAKAAAKPAKAPTKPATAPTKPEKAPTKPAAKAAAEPAKPAAKAAAEPAKPAAKAAAEPAKPAAKAAAEPAKPAAKAAAEPAKPAAKAAAKPEKPAAKSVAKAKAKSAPVAEAPEVVDPPAVPEPEDPTPAAEPAVAVEAPAEPWREPLAPIPDAFGEDRITVMARDPESAFAYWEVTEAGLAAARAASGAEASGLTLRVALTSAPGEAERFVDTPVREWVGRWMLRDLRPGSHVRTQIGLAHAGGFVAVASSPVIEVPRRNAAQAPVRFVRLGRSGAASQPAPTPAGAPTGALSPAEARPVARGAEARERTSATSSVEATPASQPKKKSGEPR